MLDYLGSLSYKNMRNSVFSKLSKQSDLAIFSDVSTQKATVLLEKLKLLGVEGRLHHP